MEKHCTKCGTTKPISDFYRNRSTRDGHQPWCKPCWRTDCDARKARDPGRRRAIARDSYHRHKHDRARIWSDRPYDQKVKARRQLQDAVARGKIRRRSCERCGAANAEGHHEDYSRPLHVRWLCSLCHAAVHRGE